MHKFLARAMAALVFAALMLVAAAANDVLGRADIDRIRNGLQVIDRQITSPAVTNEDLARLRGELDPLIDQLRDGIAAAEPAARQIEERLKELGPKPEQGRTESADVTRDREETQRRFDEASTGLRQLKAFAIQADQLSERLSDRRREILARALFERTFSVVDPALWREVAESTPRLVQSVRFFASDWWTLLAREGSSTSYIAIGLTLVVAVLVYGPLRRRLLDAPSAGVFAWGTADHPTPVQRSIMAAWTAVVSALLPALAVFIVVRVLAGVDLLPARFRPLADALVFGMMIFSGMRAVARAILSPSRPAWRFVALSDAIARRAYRSIVIAAAIVAASYVLGVWYATILAPFVVTVATSGLRSVAVALVLVIALGVIARRESEERDRAARDVEAPAAGDGRQTWRWLRLVLWLVSVVVLVAALLGYVSLAAFLSGQIVWVLIVLGGLIITTRLIDDTVSEATRAGTAANRRVATMFGVDVTSVEQVGILGSGALRVIVLVIAGFMVFAPWGVDSRDALGTLRAIFFGVQVGGFTISLSAILLAVLIFTAALVATRTIQRWLDTKYLPSTRMDAGLRNSIRTTFGYVGFIVATMFAFSALGIDVQNLAIVAGALSVGIGFGLQSIVSNFVSGLILLAERPVKQGDLIAVGDAEGYVRRINVRATEVETFDKAVLIVPNSNLIGGSVKNWMHNDHLGRARIKVTTAKGAEPEQIRDILLDIMRAHPAVLEKPSPKVFLSDFAGDGFVFETSCVIGNVERAHQVRSELRFAIARRFREEGIDMK